MSVDTSTFRKYAQISDHIADNFENGTAVEEKVRELIGAKFGILTKTTIEGHFSNMVKAHFLTAGVSGMRAKKINWVLFEDGIRRKEAELNTEGAIND